MRRTALIFALSLFAGSLSAQVAISNGASLSNGAALIPGNPCVILTNSLPPGTSGVLYDQTLQTANCLQPFVYSVFTGTFPPWATFNPATGEISGIAAPGTYSFVIKLQDGSQNAFFTQPLTISTPSGGGGGSGSPLLPDTSLLTWDTTLATGTPASGPELCVGTIVNPAALPHGGCSATFTVSQMGIALQGAVCGNIIVVQKDAFFDTTNSINNGLTIQLLDCPNNNWLIVERDPTAGTFPAEGQRIDPSYAGLPQTAAPNVPYPTANLTPNNTVRQMPRILQKGTNNQAPITIALGAGNGVASHQRWIGFETGRDDSSDIQGVAGIDLTYQPSGAGQACELVGSGIGALPVNAVACMNVQPHDLVFDRFYIHGPAQRQQTRGINFGGARRIAFVDSWGSDIQLTDAGGGGDAQFFFAGGGHGFTNVGFYKLLNNEISASTMSSLFCGAFVEPQSPATGQDGVPQSVWIGGNALIKNLLWDPMIGQTLGETAVVDGVSYPPAPDQQLVLNPASVQLSGGQSLQLNSTWLNDTFGGFNRASNSNSTWTLDGTTCTFVSGVCSIGGNTNAGILTRLAEHAVGSGAWNSQNQITVTYSVCTGTNAPVTGCGTATTAGTHTVGLSVTTQDSRLASLGNTRKLATGTDCPLCAATTTVTVVAANPSKSITVAPSASTLRMQPSYPDGSSTLANGIYGSTDAAGNYRRYAYELFAVCNYTCGNLTWKVDGVTNGNANIGSIQSNITGLLNSGAEAVYFSADAAHQGNHSITAFDSVTGVTSSPSVISVSSTAPILGYDQKPMSEKNGFECKCVNKLLFENNYLENGWGANGNGNGQVGTMTLFQAINQTNQTNDGNGVNVGYGPPYVNNVTYRNNYGRHFGTGLTIVPLNVAQGLHNILITGNVCDDCNNQRWGNGFLKIVEMISSGGTASKTVLGWTSPTNPLAAHIAITHNTFIGASTSTFSLQNYIAQFQLIDFTFQDNIIASAGTSTFVNSNGEDNDANQGNTEQLTFQGAGWLPVPIGSCKAPSSAHTWYCNVSGVGWEISVAGAAYTPTATPPGAALVAPYIFATNGLLDSTAPDSNFVTPSSIFRLSHTAAKFVNYNNGDYRLCTVALCGAGNASPFAAGQVDQAHDGTDLGGPVATDLTNVTNALTGTRTP